MSLDIASNTVQASARDFRIVANSSKSSFGAMSGTESNFAKLVSNRPRQRPNLMGANKPHMLKNQNDQIRQMLGGKEQSSKPTLEPIDQTKVRSIRNSSVKAFGDSSARAVIGGTPSLKNVKDFTDAIADTPNAGNRRLDSKRNDTLRQSGKSLGKAAKPRMGVVSVNNFGGLSDAKSIKTGSIRDARDNSFDLEDFDDVMEKIQLEGAIEEKRRMVSRVLQKDETSYKDNFLVKFFESQGDFF